MKKPIKIFIIVLLLFLNHSFAQWVPANSPDSGISHLHTIKDGTFFVCTNAGLFKSLDSGSTWIAVNTGLPGPGVSAVIEIGGVLYTGTGSGVFRSEDNGDSWIAANSGIESKGILSLVSVDDTLWAGFDGAYRSINKGISWTSYSDGLYPHRAVSALAYKDGTLFAGQRDVDFGGGLFRFVDSSDSWELIKNGLTERPSILSIFVNGDKIIVGTFVEGVVVSSDNGVSWNKEIDELISYATITDFAATGNNVFAASFGVYFSKDNGLSWIYASTGLPKDGFYEEVTSIAVLGSSVFAGTGSHGIWRRPISEFLPVQRGRQTELPSYADIRVRYPSHGARAISLTYNLPAREFVQLSIYTLSGKCIAYLENEIKDAGQHTLTINRSLLPAGVCLYLFRAGEYSRAGCMALAK